MESYSFLLERTRALQPSIQRYAVISIFEKFRLSSSDHESDAGRAAIFQCLASKSIPVTDQSVREVCRCVMKGKMKVSEGLLELQAALEGCDPLRVDLFVKGIGFVCSFAFKKDPSWSFESPESHPFVKVLSCCTEAQEELSHQVLLFIVRNQSTGFADILRFLRPLFMFSILKTQSLDFLKSFTAQLISQFSTLCTCYMSEATPIIKFSVECLRYFPTKNAEAFKYFIHVSNYVVDSYVVMLKQAHGTSKLTDEIQVCGVELLETILSFCTDIHNHYVRVEPVVELLKQVLIAQKDIGLPFIPKLVSIITSLVIVLSKAEFEHEQLSLVKLSIFLLKWKAESGNSCSGISPELLLVFPILGLVSSPASSAKTVAADSLSLLEKSLTCLAGAWGSPLISVAFPSVSKPESILSRLLEHVWFQDQFSSSIYFLRIVNASNPWNSGLFGEQKFWVYQLREYSQSMKRQKFGENSGIHVQGVQVLLSSIACLWVMHPKVESSVVETIASISTCVPEAGMSLFLVILFLHKVYASNGSNSQILLKLLEILPSLASNSAMVPLIVQTFLPMLQKDTKPVLYATAVRLLTKTWEVTDRVFGSLQEVLQPKAFSEFASERNICTSMAASIRDVCKKSPDRGVDLILSVSECIQNQDPYILFFGLESLAYLCGADVVDFYTAWDVISSHVLKYSIHPIVAYGLCTLLRWGVMDFEAYPEASCSVIWKLWEIGTFRVDSGALWIKARTSAFESLINYEVEQIQRSVPNFRRENVEIFLHEEHPEVLRMMERLETKIITYEHTTRRRAVKEKRLTVNKVEKLLDVFPQVIFSSDKGSSVRDLPGAALLSLAFTSKGTQPQKKLQDLFDMSGVYENVLTEIAESLQLSRSILLALLSLQSLKSFLYRWLRVVTAESRLFSRSSDAADHILKCMCKITEELVPRSAENIALAIGALGMILPPTDHLVIVSASKFLLKWLFQYEHEYKQWTSAISLGLLSTCLHATDSQQKFEVINGLLEVACNTKSWLVKGACGIGLGFSFQCLLTRVKSVNYCLSEEGTTRVAETALLRKVLRCLSAMICQLCPSALDFLQGLCRDSEPGSDDFAQLSCARIENYDNLEEDVWGIAGLVVGLGHSAIALYRAGDLEAVVHVKDMLISWIPHVNYTVKGATVCSGMEKPQIALSVGSCLVLPTVLTFCQRMELMQDELDKFVLGYKELISELLGMKVSGFPYQNLLMTSSIGAGNLVSSILNFGLQSLRADDVKSLLELMRNSYLQSYPPAVNLGGMLGIVNAMGADAGFLTDLCSQPLPLPTDVDQKETSHIRGPLLVTPVCEQLCTTLMQEMFLIARDCNDPQIQGYAAWAIAFLRHRWWSKESQSGNISQSNANESKLISRSFAEDSLVWQFSLWLMNLNSSKNGRVSHVNTVTTVLRCLSQAPRLPILDWNHAIRYLMRYEDQVSSRIKLESAVLKGLLREACINFSIAHANQEVALVLFLDELCGLSRFQTLELSLRCSLLSHLGNLRNIFSGARLEKLFDDLLEYFGSSSSSYQAFSATERSSLQISFWKGLYGYMTNISSKTPEHMPNVEKCMALLFCLLPGVPSTKYSGSEKALSETEWLEAMKCLTKARSGWLMDFLQLSNKDLMQGATNFTDAAKKITASARLIRVGCLLPAELGKFKRIFLDIGSDGIWNVLLEVSAALQEVDDSVKRQWLLDAVEISCIAKQPSVALQFVGLLSSGWCRHMPLLIADQFYVLSDLPVTLASLLQESNWTSARDAIVQRLWASMERIHAWATHPEKQNNLNDQTPIDATQRSTSVFLARVMHATCFALREYLPFEKQLRLADMVVPSHD